MKFPETTRRGSEGHRDAISRLEAAKAEERRRTALCRAVQGTAREPGAARGLAEAGEHVAAREAWVLWVERGC